MSRAPQVLAAVVVATFGVWPASASDPAASSGPGSVPDPATELIGNAMYPGILEEPVRLTDGVWEGETYVPDGASRPRLEWIEEISAIGDLDGDGSDETAVLLAQSSGGSGNFLHVAVLAVGENDAACRGTALVGDRAQIRTMEIADGHVILDVVEQGPDDAACCPTQLATRSWRLGEATLVEGEAEVHGPLSLAILSGSEWQLLRFDIAGPDYGGPPISIAFPESGKITGKSACNGYFGSAEETAPGRAKIGPVGATRLICASKFMEYEHRYFERLGRVERYSFLVGRLVLGGTSDEGSFTLLFAPASSDTAGNTGR